MAGDWIKMRGNLWDDPRVGQLCDLLDCGEAQVVGALYWLWATADQHTENGVLPGLSLRQIDRKTGVAGFAQALCDVGWLAEHQDGVCIARFEEHNGASAKKRAVTAKRVANHRTANPDVTPAALQNEDASVTAALAREEKRREETTVANATGGTPPTNRDLVFAKGVPLLTTSGVSEKNARSMLAALSKKHGEAAVLQAVEQTAHDRPGEPVSWLQSLLVPRPRTGETVYQASQRERVAEFAPRLAKRGPSTPTTIDEVFHVPALASR